MYKKKFFVYIPNTKLIFRDINYINFFQKIDLSNFFFVFSDNKNIPKNLKKYEIIKFNKYRYKLWDFIHFLSRLSYEKKNFGISISKQTLSISNTYFILAKFIFFFRLYRLIIFFGNFILSLTSPKILKNLSNYSKVICFGSSKDINFDDIIRSAKRFKIHSSLIFTNWDNATTKPYLYKPDTVYCWGRETARLSKKIHNIVSKSIGSIRFEYHRALKNKYLKMSKALSKKKMNLDTKFKYILFAGVTHPFDEAESLKILDNHIKKNYKNLKIIYRPHPTHVHNKKIIKNNSKNIILDLNNNENNFENYFFLLNSIEFVISPYSTLVLEGLYYQKPAICLAYNDNNQGVFNWYENSKYQPHLKIFKKKKEVFWCYSKKKLCRNFDLAIIYSEKYKKKSFDKIIFDSVYFSNDSYFDRLKKQIFI